MKPNFREGLNWKRFTFLHPFGLLSFSMITFGIMSPQAQAVGAFEIQIEPIVGYEQVQQVIPTPHTNTRLFYGARAIAGLPLIALEAQFTRGMSQETFGTSSQTNTGDRAKVGLRSSFRLSSMIWLFLRAGGEAALEKVVQVDNGVTTTTEFPIRYSPYAGTGARFWLTNKISATADVVAVFADVNDLRKTEFQATAGFALRLP